MPAEKLKPPYWAASVSWVELLNSQAGGGHYYEDIDGILLPVAVRRNTSKVLSAATSGINGYLAACQSLARLSANSTGMEVRLVGFLLRMWGDAAQKHVPSEV